MKRKCPGICGKVLKDQFSAHCGRTACIEARREKVTKLENSIRKLQKQLEAMR